MNLDDDKVGEEEEEERTSTSITPARSTATSVSTIVSFKSALDVSPSPSSSTSTSATTMTNNERRQLLPDTPSSTQSRPSKGYQTIISDEDDEDGSSGATSFSGSNDDILGEDILYKRPTIRSSFKASTNYYIYTVTILSAIGGFLFGYDTGIVSGAMIFIRDHYKLDEIWQELVVSSTILSAWIFSLVAGGLTDWLGRKKVILLASITFTVGGFLMALAVTKIDLLVGRFIVGSAVGLASMAIPVYIAEVAPVEIRGRLVTINNVCITFGQFIASILAGVFSYDEQNGFRWMLGLGAVPSMLQFIFFLFMPESPRWLAKKGHYDRASAALYRFRRQNTSPEMIREEFETIKESCLTSNSQRSEAGGTGICQVLASAPVRKALLVGCLLQAFQQLSGINTVMYYSATIIQMSGVSNKSLAVWLSTITASFNFIFSFVGIYLVERAGRRLLTLASLAGVVLSLLMLAGGFQLAEENSPQVTFHLPLPPPAANKTPWAHECNTYTTCGGCVDSGHCGFCFLQQGANVLLEQPDNPIYWLESLRRKASFNGTCLAVNRRDPERAAANYSLCAGGSNEHVTWANTWCPSQWSWTTLVGLMLYLVFFAPGMGPMPWTINSEIYPLWARSTCYSSATSVNWFFNLLVSLTFLTLTKILTKHGAFYLYAGLAALGWVLLFLLLPETKGKSLEEIELLLDGPMLVGLAGKRNGSGYRPVGRDIDDSDMEDDDEDDDH